MGFWARCKGLSRKTDRLLCKIRKIISTGLKADHKPLVRTECMLLFCAPLNRSGPNKVDRAVAADDRPRVHGAFSLFWRSGSSKMQPRKIGIAQF